MQLVYILLLGSVPSGMSPMCLQMLAVMDAAHYFSIRSTQYPYRMIDGTIFKYHSFCTSRPLNVCACVFIVSSLVGQTWGRHAWRKRCCVVPHLDQERE